MHFSTVVLPLSLALGGLCDTIAPSKSLPQGLTYAHQYQHRHLEGRTDLPIEYMCGDNAVDCGNGWCCLEGEKCSGVLSGIPLCGVDSWAAPFKNIESVYASATKVLYAAGYTTLADLPNLSSIMSEASEAALATASFESVAAEKTRSIAGAIESVKSVAAEKTSSIAGAIESAKSSAAEKASSINGSIESAIASATSSIAGAIESAISTAADAKATGGAARVVAAWGAAAVGGAGLLLF